MVVKISPKPCSTHFRLWSWPIQHWHFQGLQLVKHFFWHQSSLLFECKCDLMEEDFRKMEIFSVVNLNDVYRRILFSDFFLIIYLIFLKNIFKKSLLRTKADQNILLCVCKYLRGRQRQETGKCFFEFFWKLPAPDFKNKIKNKKHIFVELGPALWWIKIPDKCDDVRTYSTCLWVHQYLIT